ncbi:MAG: hypothetical protein H6734_27330 [Alphaproteobacteria bacterium]|nr:hypothetical protein [Alphaproteobacteria bacterium]
MRAAISLVVVLLTLVPSWAAHAETEKVCAKTNDANLCTGDLQKARCVVAEVLCDLEARMDADLFDISAGFPPATNDAAGAEDTVQVHGWLKGAAARLRALDEDVVRAGQLRGLGCIPKSNETPYVCLDQEGGEWVHTGYKGLLYPGDLVHAMVVVPQDDDGAYDLSMRQVGSGDVSLRTSPKPAADADSRAAPDAPSSAGLAKGVLKTLDTAARAPGGDMAVLESFVGKSSPTPTDVGAFEEILAKIDRDLRLKVAAEASLVVSTDGDPRFVLVSFLRTANKKADEKGVVPRATSTTHKLFVDAGRYYFDVAVTVAFVPPGQGVTEVGQRTLPGTNTEAVRVEDGWRQKVGLGLNVYPFGRRRNHISSLHDCSSLACVGEMVGIQVATDPNLTQLDRESILLGLLIEPVSGFAVAGGVGWFKTTQLAEPWRDGALLGSDEAPATRSKRVAAGYFGLSVSTEIFQAARSVARGIGAGDAEGD